MSEAAIEGLVVSKSSRNVRVRSGDAVWLCSLRGRLRGGKTRGLPVVVGDQVLLRPTGPGEAVLEEVLPRRNELRRARITAGRGIPSWRMERRIGAEEHVVAANMDHVLIVLAARSPPPRWGLVDRVLISSHFDELDVGICLNKWDQVAQDSEEASRLEKALAVYAALGHGTFRTSMAHGEGKEELGRWLAGRFTVFSGHSGVGKSTIINVFSTERAATGEVNVVTGKGRHVTTAATCYEIAGGGYLVDTPGYREYGLLDLDPADVGRHYDEFRPHIGSCRFGDCLHKGEPGCALRQAVERGEVSQLRYRNYLQILGSLRGEG